MTLKQKPFGNIVGKGENAVYQHFLLFPNCFLPFLKTNLSFQSHLFYCLQNLSIWINLKNLLFEKVHAYHFLLRLAEKMFYRNSKASSILACHIRRLNINRKDWNPFGEIWKNLNVD